MTSTSSAEHSSIPTKVLAVTSQYPNAAYPRQAAFNRQQFTELSRNCDLSVVAPLPWKQTLGPGVNPVDPLPGAPEARRPTFWYLPKIKRQWHGWCYYKSIWSTVKELTENTQFDVMLATWLFPDGYAAARMARQLGLPLVIKLHGSDILVQGKDKARRKKMLQALDSATRVVAVSQALASSVIEMGADEAKVRVVANGIDRDLFRPGHHLRARLALGLEPRIPYLLYLGRLEKVKGPDVALETMALLMELAHRKDMEQIRDVTLLMVGTGSMEGALREQAESLGIGQRVHFIGECEHKEVPRYLAASELLLLPSRSEGQPNAVLEALSAQRPVVATAVGGVPELIRDGRQGALCPPDDPTAMAGAILKVLGTEWDPRQLTEPLGHSSWEASAKMLLDVLQEAIAES